MLALNALAASFLSPLSSLVGSGQTLCSASTPGHPGGVRRVFHIRVQ